jgi:hypothetical protein
MKVKEIIEVLQQCNPELECYGYFKDDIRNVEMVDNSMEDRVEFNLEELEGDEYEHICIRQITYHICTDAM